MKFRKDVRFQCFGVLKSAHTTVLEHGQFKVSQSQSNNQRHQPTSTVQAPMRVDCITKGSPSGKYPRFTDKEQTLHVWLNLKRIEAIVHDNPELPTSEWIDRYNESKPALRDAFSRALGYSKHPCSADWFEQQFRPRCFGASMTVRQLFWHMNLCVTNDPCASDLFQWARDCGTSCKRRRDFAALIKDLREQHNVAIKYEDFGLVEDDIDSPSSLRKASSLSAAAAYWGNQERVLLRKKFLDLTSQQGPFESMDGDQACGDSDSGFVYHTPVKVKKEQREFSPQAIIKTERRSRTSEGPWTQVDTDQGKVEVWVISDSSDEEEEAEVRSMVAATNFNIKQEKASHTTIKVSQKPPSPPSSSPLSSSSSPVSSSSSSSSSSTTPPNLSTFNPRGHSLLDKQGPTRYVDKKHFQGQIISNWKKDTGDDVSGMASISKWKEASGMVAQGEVTSRVVDAAAKKAAMEAHAAKKRTNVKHRFTGKKMNKKQKAAFLHGKFCNMEFVVSDSEDEDGEGDTLIISKIGMSKNGENKSAIVVFPKDADEGQSLIDDDGELVEYDIGYVLFKLGYDEDGNIMDQSDIDKVKARAAEEKESNARKQERRRAQTVRNYNKRQQQASVPVQRNVRRRSVQQQRAGA